MALPKAKANIVSEMELTKLVSELFEDVTGSQLADTQHKHVSSRVAKRMRELQIETPDEYWKYLQVNETKEVPKLVSLLTTHHTFFFREFPQFEIFLQKALPQVIQGMKKDGRTHLKVWSAGCSRGQEVYSLAMFLHYHLPKLAPGFTFEIMGSDICSESITIANNGVYHWDELKEIPAMYLEGNWIEGKGSISDYAKVQSFIKAHCTFQIINLKNVTHSLANTTFDIIFCRNVFIYFINQRIQTITSEILKHLDPNGFLFLGMTENLIGLELPVTFLGTSVYRHATAPVLIPEATKELPQMAKIRVLCVDDSPTVLKLLSHILSPSFGFEVVGTASNGIEAAKFLETNKVDVVTLDIHMPELNGVEYLKKYHNKTHPPVVIVSTVAREDADLAHKALELGAKDYIEKPALDGIVQRGDEIRAKLKCVYQDHLHPSDKPKTHFEAAFEKSFKLDSLENKLRVIIAGPSSLDQAGQILDEMSGPQPPVVVLFNNPDNIMSAVEAKLKQKNRKVEPLNLHTHAELVDGTIYLGQLSSFDVLKDQHSETQVSVMALEIPPEDIITKLKSWQGIQVIVKEQLNHNLPNYKLLRQIANEVVPYTSFLYASNTFFNRKYLDEKSRSVVSVTLLKPSVFSNNEIVKINTSHEAMVCLYHTRQSRGGVLIVPEDIMKQDSLLLEQSIVRLISLFGAHGDNVRAKIVGSVTIIKKIGELLSEHKIAIGLTREVTLPTIEAYFFTDSGRLRLPKTLAEPVKLEKVVTRAAGRIKVLVVDDSKVIRDLLKRIISEDEILEVVGEADRPSKVAPLIEKLRPDVITLDIEMPEMSGVELLTSIMPKYSIPTIMISSISMEEGEQVIRAMELGAFDYIQKPEFSELAKLAPYIREKIKTAVNFKPQVKKNGYVTTRLSSVEHTEFDDTALVAIGASTGGTAAIKTILTQFPEKIPAIVIAQHIPPVFSKAFADRLKSLCKFDVREAKHGDLVQPGVVLIAPGGMQMEVVLQDGIRKIKIFDTGTTHLHNPSVDVLFNSVAAVAGAKAVGVLLTGMGRDGAEGLLKMRQNGAKTVVQDEDSCSVFGMPKAAIAIGAAELVKPLDQIAQNIFTLLKKSKKLAA